LSSQLGSKIEEERAGADALGEDDSVIMFRNGCGLDIGRICSNASTKLSVSARPHNGYCYSKVVVGNMNGYSDHTLSLK
jgi:hypothetical protein